jgi:hypothetical protein
MITFLYKKISSLSGYIALLVVVGVFAVIYNIANNAEHQADLLVESTLSALQDSHN